MQILDSYNKDDDDDWFSQSWNLLDNSYKGVRNAVVAATKLYKTLQVARHSFLLFNELGIQGRLSSGENH